jgi:hypothetical protein
MSLNQRLGAGVHMVTVAGMRQERDRNRRGPHEAVRFPLERALMEYRVEITIPEAREDVFMSIFEALVDQPNPVTAVGDMDRTGLPSHFVLAVDAVDAHQASTTAVELFRDAVARSGMAPTAEMAILDLHADRAPEKDKLQDSDELQPA